MNEFQENMSQETNSLFWFLPVFIPKFKNSLQRRALPYDVTDLTENHPKEKATIN